MPSRWRGAIFDCDGLLVDTRHCWEAAYRAAVAEAGVTLSEERFATLCESLNGASVGIATERLGAALGREVSAAFLGGALEEAITEGPLCPLAGVERLLGELSGKLPLAVASNAPAVVVEAALHGAGLRDHFTHVVTAEQVPAPKPDPAVYREACRRLRVDPVAAVGFEDSPLGAAAARGAGLFLIGVPSEGSMFDADITATSISDARILEALGLAVAPSVPCSSGRLPWTGTGT